MKRAFGKVPEPNRPKISEEIKSQYNNIDRINALVGLNEEVKAHASFYGAADPIVPSAEFSGGGFGFNGGFGLYGNCAGFGDSYSWPGRYGVGIYGGLNKEGWRYNKSGQSIDHQRIAQCIMMYKTEGTVQNIVHLLADFATEGIRIEHENESVSNFYKAWAKKINLNDRVHRIIIDLLVSGNVFLWRKEAKIKPSEKMAMKKGQAYSIDNELFDERTHKTIGDLTREIPKGTKIPWGYISLNPLQINLRGSRFSGNHYWAFALDKKDLKAVRGGSKNHSSLKNYSLYDDIGDTEVDIPKEFKHTGKLKSSDINSYKGEVKLDNDRLNVIQDVTKTDYEAWATPSIYPAYKEVMFKRMMRAGEISAVESLKNTITLLKLGNVEEGLTPDPESIKRLASAIAAGSQSHYLIWDNLIEGQVLQPDIGRILDPKKYESIDKDIFMALGVSETVMTGKGSYANSFLSIKLLLEKLETLRNKIINWLLFEVKIIAERMNFRKLPEIRFGLMNLRDENAERKLLTDLFDRGVLSQKTLLEFYDLNYDHERIRQLVEKGNIEKDNNPEEEEKDVFGNPKPPVEPPVMMPTGPFRKIDKTSTNGPKPFSGPNGRPKDTQKEQEVKRNTKPKGMSSLALYDKYRQFAMEALPVVKKCLTESMIALHDVKDVRSLNGVQKAALDENIYLVMSQITPDDTVTENLVYNRLGIIRSQKVEASNNLIYARFCEVADEFSNKADEQDGFCRIYAAIHSNLGAVDE